MPSWSACTYGAVQTRSNPNQVRPVERDYRVASSSARHDIKPILWSFANSDGAFVLEFVQDATDAIGVRGTLTVGTGSEKRVIALTGTLAFPDIWLRGTVSSGGEIYVAGTLAEGLNGTLWIGETKFPLELSRRK